MLPGLSPEDDHRRVRARLETDGWKWLARGDWSQVYASPDGRQVARVVAFDPAYALHVRTCLANPGVAHFQRIDWHRDLAPAGQVVVMERLQPAAEAPASHLCCLLGATKHLEREVEPLVWSPCEEARSRANSSPSFAIFFFLFCCQR